MTLTNDITNGVNEAMTDIIDAAEPAKKGKKPAKPKAEKPVAKPKPEPVKPEPVTFHGFEVHEGVDLAELESLTKDAAAAFDAVGRKDSDLLSHYLALGAFQSKASGLFKSTKIYGQFLAKELPASQTLDPALRSNCKWLWEALNLEGHEASDLLVTLRVNDIASFKSGNPTVIKREYKLAKDKHALAEKAKAAGVEGDDEDALAEAAKALTKQEKEAQAKKDEKAFNAALGRAISRIRKELKEHGDDVENIIEDALQMIKDVAKLNPADSLAYLQSGGSVANPED